MERQPRFKVINHRNGTKTLIDNQTGMHFFRSDKHELNKAIALLQKQLPTNTNKYFNNYIICFTKDIIK